MYDAFQASYDAFIAAVESETQPPQLAHGTRQMAQWHRKTAASSVGGSAANGSGKKIRCSLEVAEAKWPHEDGSWTKKYYPCRIMEQLADDDGNAEFMVQFLEDQSQAKVPDSRLKFCQAPRDGSDDVHLAAKKAVLLPSKATTDNRLKSEPRSGSDVHLARPGMAPEFDERAHGTPLEWNKFKPLIWSRRLSRKTCFWQSETMYSSVDESITRVKEFLATRKGPDNTPISERLQYAHADSGWYKFQWIPYEAAGGESSLPKTSPGPHGDGFSDWQRAWHGCKFEALYSIMYHGRLFASCDAERGERFFRQAPGVYLHKDATCKKTGNYFRFVPLCNDGVFWAALWEVMIDRADRIVVKHSDQWVQPERSVKLVALWLVGCQYEHMQSGWEVSEAWNPLLEAHPIAMQHRAVSTSSISDGVQP